MSYGRELGWDLESLNKAYRQGYMAGNIRMQQNRCPYQSDVVRAAWEAGWEDGINTDSEPRSVACIAPTLTAYIAPTACIA